MDDKLRQARAALTSDNYRTRVHGITIIGMHGTREDGPRVVELLHDEDYRVRMAALDALGKLRYVDALSNVVRLLRDREKLVRGAAVSALGAFQDERALDSLITWLLKGDREFRDIAIRALLAIGDPRAREPLLHVWRNDHESLVSLDVGKVVATFPGPEVVDILIAALADRDDDVRGAAAIALGSLGDPRALPALQYMAANDGGEHWWTERGGACSTAGTAEQAIATITARQNGDAGATMLNRPAHQRHRMPDYIACHKAFVQHSTRAKAVDEPFPDEDAPEGFVDRIELRFYRREGRYRVSIGTITVDWYKHFPATSGVIEDPVPQMQVPWEAWGGLAHCADLIQRLDRSNAPAMQPDEFAVLLKESGFEDESIGVPQIGWSNRPNPRVAVHGIPLPTLPGGFPARLLQAAYDLRQHHTAGLAWPYPTILEVVSVLTERGYAILGGDMYREEESGGLNLTYDNWYIEPENDWSWAQYVEESGRKAITYVEWYHAKFGDAYWYQPVFALTLPEAGSRHTP